MIFLQTIAPQHLLSKLMFRLARIKHKWFKNTFIRWFVRHYQVDLAEAQRQNIEDYQHFNDFFTRALKKNVRPLASNAIICPVDGMVSQAGRIKNSKILQAKNHYYSLQSLLADEPQSAVFSEGQFATIYLSPKDYHRVHMPYDGVLQEMRYISGDLFSVNQHTSENIDTLFARNERVICYFHTAFGLCALVLVGAIFVGSMELVWHGLVQASARKKSQYFDYKNQNIHLKKGEELGRFNMGSTVIMLMPNDSRLLSLRATQTVKMGQSL